MQISFILQPELIFNLPKQPLKEIKNISLFGWHSNFEFMIRNFKVHSLIFAALKLKYGKS